MQQSGQAPLLCSTGGSTSVNVTPSFGDRYYLIVAHDGVYRGTYGVDDAGGARPAGPTQCFPTASTTSCP